MGSIWPSRLCSLVEICLKIGSLSAINFSRAESQDFPERLLCVWQRAGARVRWAAKEQVWEGREALCMVHGAIFQEHWLDMAGVTLVGSLPNPSAPMVADELYVRDNPLQNVLGVAWSRIHGDQSKLRGKGLLLTPHSFSPFVMSGRLHGARARVEGSILLTHSKGAFKK